MACFFSRCHSVLFSLCAPKLLRIIQSTMYINIIEPRILLITWCIVSGVLWKQIVCDSGCHSFIYSFPGRIRGFTPVQRRMCSSWFLLNFFDFFRFAVFPFSFILCIEKFINEKVAWTKRAFPFELKIQVTCWCCDRLWNMYTCRRWNGLRSRLHIQWHPCLYYVERNE